jgi:hypothetical protein
MNAGGGGFISGRFDPPGPARLEGLLEAPAWLRGAKGRRQFVEKLAHDIPERRGCQQIFPPARPSCNSCRLTHRFGAATIMRRARRATAGVAPTPRRS